VGTDKTFTQADVDRIVQERVGKERARLEAAQARATELQRERDAVVGERDALTKRVEAAQLANRDRTLHAALEGARVLPMARDVAYAELLRNSTIEHAENGDVAAVVYGETRFEDAGEAAKAFLESRPYFQRPAAGGAGSSRSLGSPNGRGDISKADPMKLATEGWLEKA
jgi:hypothetical protein